MSALIFMDTETTGLSLADDIWEFAAIRRDPDGTETELHLFIEHDENKCKRLPDPFKADHTARFPAPCSGLVTPRTQAAHRIGTFMRKSDGLKPHVVGAVPNFDTERVALLLATVGNSPEWHHHLIDVENLAVGYLAGGARDGLATTPALPWDSDNLSRAVGVDSETFPRHTAMGDVRWAMAIYDAVMGGAA